MSGDKYRLSRVKMHELAKSPVHLIENHAGYVIGNSQALALECLWLHSERQFLLNSLGMTVEGLQVAMDNEMTKQLEFDRKITDPPQGRESNERK